MSGYCKHCGEQMLRRTVWSIVSRTIVSRYWWCPRCNHTRNITPTPPAPQRK